MESDPDRPHLLRFQRALLPNKAPFVPGDRGGIDGWLLSSMIVSSEPTAPSRLPVDADLRTTKAKILDAAYRRLAREGYAALSMREIARDAVEANLIVTELIQATGATDAMGTGGTPIPESGIICSCSESP